MADGVKGPDITNILPGLSLTEDELALERSSMIAEGTAAETIPEPEKIPEPPPPGEEKPPVAPVAPVAPVEEPGTAGDETIPEPGKGEPEKPIDGEPSEEEPEADAQGRVPLAALRETRTRLKAAEAQAGAERELRAKLEEATNNRIGTLERAIEALLHQERARQAGSEKKEPEVQRNPYDPETQPLEHEQWERKQDNARLEAQLVETRQATAQDRMRMEQQWVHSQTTNFVQQFASENPDYYDALKFLEERRIEQIRLAFPLETPENHLQRLANERTGIVLSSVRRNPDGTIVFHRSPPEAIYSLAKSMGYAKKEAETPAAPANGGGTSASATPAARAKAAGRSLSTIPGSATGGSLTAEKLDQMDQAAFEKLMKENPKLVDRLMGAEE